MRGSRGGANAASSKPPAGSRARRGRRRAAAPVGVERDAELAERDLVASIFASTRFIAGEPMNAATKRSRGSLVELLRRVDLEDLPVAHDRDALPERHRLDLVVRDVDRRHAEPRVELRERRAHADAQLRVEVRERLVHQERLRLADDRAAHRDPLALAARELRRPPVEELLEPEQLRDLVDPPCDLVLRRPPHLEPVAEVLADGHVRVERVALEDHRDVAMARGEVGDVAVADRDRARASTSSSPAIMRSSVDFPQPDGPTRTMNSPSRDRRGRRRRRRRSRRRTPS